MKKGILLINLGTPDECSPISVRRYLKIFLNDPRVIDLPKVIRWIFVNLMIIPFRFKKTARAYQKIWLGAGSPLLVHSLQLKQSLAYQLGEEYQVELGMRYGNPSIETALKQLKHCSKITVLPLFPQYASATTGSAIEKVLGYFQKQWNIPSLEIKKDFYADPLFINAYANVIHNALKNKNTDKVLFSYHGLPERHIHKSHCQATCDHQQACPMVDETNAYCYRAQCYASSHLLAEKLGFSKEKYQTSFQSRLGHTPWIKPYSDLVLPKLIQQGIKNIAVVCPSFTADCLETLEEVNIRMRAQWLELGGKDFIYIPCLNEDPVWVSAVAGMVNNKKEKKT